MQKCSFFKKVSVVMLAIVLQVVSVNCSDQTQTSDNCFEYEIVRVIYPGAQTAVPTGRYVHLRIDKDSGVLDRDLEEHYQEAMKTAFNRFQSGRPSENVVVDYKNDSGRAVIRVAYGFLSLEEAQNHVFGRFRWQ